MTEGFDQYTIDRKLSEGGMAEVYLAHRHDGDGSRPVVIKGVLPGFAGDTDYVRMMRNEARIAASLCHPNIVRIEDLVETGGRPFIVMEYLDGRNLNQIVQRAIAQQRRLSRAFVCSVVIKMLAGLGHAHDLADDEARPLGLVHRDVSLGNVIVTWSGRVALIDFGIAKATSAVDDGLTRVGVIKGKTSYMSPEQIKREPLDRRADIFAVGVVLWEMLTHQRLFARRGGLDIMMAICAEDAAPPSSVVPSLPAALDRICGRALARDREQRYQTAAEMRAELEAVIEAEGGPADDAALEAELAALFPVESAEARDEQMPALYDEYELEEEELATTVQPRMSLAARPAPPPASPPTVTTLRCHELTLLNQRLPGPSVYDEWLPVARSERWWSLRGALLVALIACATLALATMVQLGGAAR